jgi:hypothetical protein
MGSQGMKRCFLLWALFVIATVQGFDGIRIEPFYQNDKQIDLNPDQDFAIPNGAPRFIQVLVDFELRKPGENLNPAVPPVVFDEPAFKIFVGKKAIEFRSGVCRIFDISEENPERKLLGEVPLPETDFSLPNELEIDLIGDFIHIDVNNAEHADRKIKGVFTPDGIAFSSYGESARIHQITVNGLFVDSIAIFPELNSILAKGVYQPQQFNRGPASMRNHHFIASSHGYASYLSLINTVADDNTIHDALLKVNAEPGDVLAPAGGKKGDQKSADPDNCLDGSKMDIQVLGKEAVYDANEILIEKKGKKADFYFGGHRQFFPLWKSGCVACLQSCPSGPIGSKSHTLRDLSPDQCDFKVSGKVNLRENEEVYVEFHPEP